MDPDLPDSSHIDTMCQTLLTSCLNLVNTFTTPGCDAGSFVHTAQVVTTELQSLLNVVKNVCSTAKNPEDLHNSTLTLKSTVVKILTQIRDSLKSSQLLPPGDMKNELLQVIKLVRLAAGKVDTSLDAQQRAQLSRQQQNIISQQSQSQLPIQPRQAHSQVQSQMPQSQQSLAQSQSLPQPVPQSPSVRPRLGPPSAKLQHFPFEAGSAADSPSTISQTNSNDENQPVLAQLAIKSIELLTAMSAALTHRDRDKFTQAIKHVIQNIERLIQEMKAIRDNNSVGLRKDLVSLVSHSKMHFVNPDDQYIKKQFFLLLDKVESAVANYVPEHLRDLYTQQSRQRHNEIELEKTITPNSSPRTFKPSTSPSSPEMVIPEEMVDQEQKKTLQQNNSPMAGKRGNFQVARAGSRGRSIQNSPPQKPIFDTNNIPTNAENNSNPGTFNAHGNDTPAHSLNTPDNPRTSISEDQLSKMDSKMFQPRTTLNSAPAEASVNTGSFPPTIISISASSGSISRNIDTAEIDPEQDDENNNTTPADKDMSAKKDLKRKSDPMKWVHQKIQPSNLKQPPSFDLVGAVRANNTIGGARPTSNSNPTISNSENRSLPGSTRTSVAAPRVPAQRTRGEYEADSHANPDSVQDCLDMEDNENDENNLLVENSELEGLREYDPANADVVFAKNFTQLVKTTCPRDWENLSEEEVANFEEAVRQRLLAYKKMSLVLQNYEQARKPPAVGGIPPGNNSIFGGNIKTQIARGREMIGGGLLRADTLQNLLPIGGKKTAKTEVPYFRFYDRILGPATGHSPRTKSYRTLSDLVCILLSDIHNFTLHFSDNSGLYWKSPSSRDEAKDTAIKKKTIASVKKVMVALRETLDLVANFPVQDKDSSIEKVKQRVLEAFAADKQQGEISKIDSKLFTKGQYSRYMRWALLSSIYYKIDTLYYTACQYSTIVRGYASTEPATCHLLALAALFMEHLDHLLNNIETFFFVLQEESNTRASIDRTHIKRIKGPKPDDIWSEKDESKSLDKSDLFRPGTLNGLVIRLTGSTSSSNLMGAFLIGYELFSSPKDVWEKLLDRYHVPERKLQADHQEAQFLKMRVVNFIIQWIRQEFHSIDTNVLASIEHFAEKRLKKDKWNDLSKMIILELGSPERFPPIVPAGKEIPKTLPCIAFINGIEPHQVLFAETGHAVAEQISLLELELFQRINRVELTDQKWSKEKFHVLAGNLMASIQHVNSISFFVAAAILLQKKLKDRVKMLGRIIGIAKSLSELHNFNSLMGVLAGLGALHISRLKFTWGKLSAKYLEMYETMNLHQDPTQSFKYLRDALKNAGNVAIPYVGTYLSDLTFMDDGNPDFIEVDDEKLINFPKHHLIYRTIKQLQQYKTTQFEFHPSEPLYTLLHQKFLLSEEELYAMSLEREPRNAQLKDIVQ